MTISAIHPACLPPEQLLHDCRIERTRGSGPGGQHRNKVETAVRLTHQPTGISASASERRSQERNRAMAVFRLRVQLALEHRVPIDVQTYQPSALWQARCRGRTIAINAEHGDFPALLAEAMDVLAAVGDDPQVAATILGCSASQLIKLLRKHPRALAIINTRREARGAHLLR